MQSIRIPLFDEAGKALKLPALNQSLAESLPKREEGEAAGKLMLDFEGEPTENLAFSMFTIQAAKYGLHPIFRTVLPTLRENDLWLILNSYVNTINETYNGTGVTLVLDLGSTSEKARHKLHPDGVVSITETSKMLAKLPPLKNGGKIVLSFQSGYPIDADKLCRLFPPDMFCVEICMPKDEPVLPLDNVEDIERAGYRLLDAEHPEQVLEEGE